MPEESVDPHGADEKRRELGSEFDRDTEWLAEVKAGYEEVADAYDEGRDPDEETAIVESMSEQLDPDSLVVDAGCGGGRGGLETLAERHRVVGLDISRAQLELAGERVPGARLAQGDLTRLPLATDSADGLTSLHAVIHVPRDRHGDVFAEFARVLRPGGELLVTAGTGPWEGHNEAWLADRAEGDADDGAPMRWSFHGEDRTRDLLEAAGFDVLDATVLADELDEGEWLFVRARLAG